MEMLCPECMGPLVTSDGETATCTLHGGQYRILFSRQPTICDSVAEPAAAATAGTVPAVNTFSPGVRAAVDGVMCANHPEVQAERYCKACNKPICGTCDFALPGNVHVCPACATETKPGMSSARKKLLTWGVVLAVWSTVGLVILFLVAGATAGQPGAEETIGVVFSFLVFIPSLIGTALSFAARDRRLANPPLIWVAIVWNVIILGVLILLCLVGSLVTA